jgi:DNA polymerase-3 subunit epsilon
MLSLAGAQRFEEAALTRDRLGTLLGAVRRHLLVEALRSAEHAEVQLGDSTWIIDRGRLLDATRAGTAGSALPIPPPEPATGDVLTREQIDEALCLARFCDKRASQLTVRCSGTWSFPLGDRIPDLSTLSTRAA